VANPTKVSEDFRSTITDALTQHGWAEPLWLETARDDPGRSMIKTAVEAEVEMVITAGGDGTVRLAVDGLAGTPIILGIVPAGTGNLLARNLSLPLNERGALEVIFAGRTRKIDVVDLTADDRPPESFAVMAGAGIDSAIMTDADPVLKAKLGPAAYFFAVGKAFGRLPMDATIQVDDHRPRHRKAMLVLVGNVGQLPGGIDLLPRAQPDDGRLHIFVASPRSFWQWLRVTARVLTRRARKDDPVDALGGHRVRISMDPPEEYELDGDVLGECRRLEAIVRPGALTVCVPGPG